MEVDTIVSLSTAPGVGAIAIVRLSGPGAVAVLERLISGGSAVPPPRSPALRELVDPQDGESLDRAMVTHFVGPASYTGEDLVEISCHGGWLVPALIVDACERAGARPAEPGEFTKRAYLNGKLDLIQAEAIADLIEARSRALHRAALVQLESGLSRRVSDMRERLVHLEALLAHHLDFPEEDDAPVPVTVVASEATALVADIETMLKTAPEGELLREGALAVFAGRPNAGKSSLYNALLGEDRAIVTKEPGTTRDALEAAIQLGGFPFRIVDTAGLRDTREHIEQLGVEVARRYVDRADVLLYCVAGDEGMTEADSMFLRECEGRPIVLIETKADLMDPGSSSPTESSRSPLTDLPPSPLTDSSPSPGVGFHDEEIAIAGRVRISVVSGEGLDALKALMPELIYASLVHAEPGLPVLIRRRQARALEVARSEIESFRDGLRDGLPAEVAATHLRSAESALEELLGIVSVDDVLDVVFREFCVGK